MELKLKSSWNIYSSQCTPTLVSWINTLIYNVLNFWNAPLIFTSALSFPRSLDFRRTSSSLKPGQRGWEVHEAQEMCSIGFDTTHLDHIDANRTIERVDSQGQLNLLKRRLVNSWFKQKFELHITRWNY